METILVRERYKVVQVIEAKGAYACAQAVDIAEREMPSCLLNIYEGVLATRYAGIYAALVGCPAFQDAFVTQDSLVAVFAPCGGTPIDQMFYRGAAWPWRARLDYAEQLLHAALAMTDLPPEVSCAALLSDNVRIDQNNRRVNLRFAVLPMDGMNGRELALLAADQVQKILAPRFDQCAAEYDFCARLREDVFGSIVPLYACWRRAAEQITAEYEALEQKNRFKRWLALLWMHVKRKRKKRR